MSNLILLNSTYIFPSEEKCRTFRGNFCGLSLKLPYAPNGILFTPAYPVYDNNTRRLIRKAYLSYGYTHFPISLCGPKVYRNIYPDWNDALINNYLYELLRDGLVPVCFAFNDSFNFNKNVDPKLVPIIVPGWENPKPIIKPVLDDTNQFYLCHKQYPKALIYWHNPPNQGTPYVDQSAWSSDPKADVNAKVWNYMVHESNVQGLLFQGQAWINNAESSISRLNDFVIRLSEGHNGWPKADLVDFEETAYYMFDMNGNYNQAIQWTTKIYKSFPSLNGYCNGVQ